MFNTNLESPENMLWKKLVNNISMLDSLKTDSQVKNSINQHSVLINHTKHANVPVQYGWAENMLKIQAKDSQHGKISDTGVLQAKKK